MPMVFSNNKSLPIVPFFTVKLPWPEYFMAMKSIFDIKCFKDVKFLGRTISFTFIIYRNQKTFFKIAPPPPPPPPPCATKSFACICVTIFYALYGSSLLAQGRERCSTAQKPKAYAHKMHFLPNKKWMTVIKFSGTNLLNCFVFCAGLT